jgi:hypothetical protein
MDNFVPSGRCELDVHDTSRTQLSCGSNHLRDEVRPQFAMDRSLPRANRKSGKKTGIRQIKYRSNTGQIQLKYSSRSGSGQQPVKNM